MSGQTDTEVLQGCIKTIVADLSGGLRAPIAIQRQASSCSSSYASEVVTVELPGDKKLRLFLKNFGTSYIAKNGMRARRERELGAYRDLLRQASLGTARYYGSVWDESEGRFWLLLEFVDAVPVRYCELEYWVEAAAWLGRMHGYFSRQQDRLASCDFLLRHTADYFWSIAEIALQALAQTAGDLSARLRKALSGYDRVVTVMASQPLSLVHGAYVPSQILAGQQAEETRICPIDWELAALGSPLYDLAFFSDGFQPPMLDRIWEAYRREATSRDVFVPDRETMKGVVDCFRFHKVINWLSQSKERAFPERKVANLVAMAEQFAQLAGSAEG
jgi:hypothetical protein